MPSAPPGSAPFFSRADADFWWLPVVDLGRLSDVLSDEVVAGFMGASACGSLELLRRAAARHRMGQSLQLAILGRLGGPIGRCGLLPYRGLPGWLQTVTYLAPAYWGGSTNRLVKHLLAEIAYALGHRHVIMSVAVGNLRSIAAATRLTGQSGELCHEPWYPRLARRFVMQCPGGGLELSPHALRQLAEQPAYAALLASDAANVCPRGQPPLLARAEVDDGRALSA